MTGRYMLTAAGEEIVAHFGASLRYGDIGAHLPRYNVAPTQIMPIVRSGSTGPELVAARWGLIPAWAKDVSFGAALFNARADTVAAKPAFRIAFKRRRCLVPADGFYLWKPSALTRGAKQPYRVALKTAGLFAFAGLWERWSDPQGRQIDSYAIITTEANSTIKPIEDRMPIIVPREHYARWLGIVRDPAYVLTLIEPTSAGSLVVAPVAPLVNNPANDCAQCIAPYEPSSART